MATCTRRSASRRTPRPTRSRRPTASSRASTTRTRIRATPRPRRASRRSSAPTTCSRIPEKRKQYDRFGAANGRRAGGGPAARRTEFGDFDLGDIFGGLFGGRGGGAGARRRSPSAAPTSRRRSSISFEDSLQGVEARVPVEVETRLPHVPRHRRRARHRAERLPRVRRPRRPRRLAGPVRAPAAVPALPRQRHGHREAVRDLPRHRPRAGTKRYTVKIPAGVKDGTRIRLKGKGEAGCGGGAGRRPLRRHARRAVAALRAPRRRPRARRAGHLSRGGARRDGRDADAGRQGLAQGPGRLAGRQAADASRAAARRS